jgi:hypothetical protein
MSHTADNWPADRWPNFSFAEMAGSAASECAMKKATRDRLQLLRSKYGSPSTITCGYRSPHHSEAAKTTGPDSHVRGRAVEIACTGSPMVSPYFSTGMITEIRGAVFVLPDTLSFRSRLL